MHSHPLGRSEATPTPCPTTTPFNAFRPVPGGALYTVFTATLGLIKGLSVSRLGCEPRTPGHSRGCVLQGRSWAQRGLPHPGARSECPLWDPGHCHPLRPTSRSSLLPVVTCQLGGPSVPQANGCRGVCRVGQLHLVFRSTGGPACPCVAGGGFCVTHPAEEETEIQSVKGIWLKMYSFSWGLNLGLLDTRL